MGKFERVFNKNKNVVISYVMVGDGGFEKSLEYARYLIENGVDILELGMPFSDPAADGETIIKAGQRALAEGTNLETVFRFAARLKEEYETPLVLMSYLNPLYQYGFERACKGLKSCGIDGVIIPDLPYEESEAFNNIIKKNNLCLIPLVALTTGRERVKKIVKESEGFIYLVAVKGITGTQAPIYEEVSISSKLIREHTTTPVVAGFGIKNEEDIKSFKKSVDGVVLGSRFIELKEEGNLEEIRRIINQGKTC